MIKIGRALIVEAKRRPEDQPLAEPLKPRGLERVRLGAERVMIKPIREVERPGAKGAVDVRETLLE